MIDNNQPLTGKELLKKLDEWDDKDKLELIKACGYDDYITYYKAILDAKGLLPDEEPTGTSSEHAEELSRRATEKGYEDDYQGAIEDYSKAIEIDPNYADAYASRGCLKMNSDDYQGAIEDYSKAIEINPNIALWVHNRASAKQELGLLQDALADFNEEIKLSPDDPFAYRSRGDIKNSLGDYKGAIEDYEKAIKHDAFNVCAKKIRPKLDNLKSIYKKELERQGSIKQSSEPKTAAEYLDRGCDKDDQKDSKGAIEDYSKAIELNPNYSEAYANRGCAKEELGDKEGAISDWQKALDLGDEEAAKWLQELKASNEKNNDETLKGEKLAECIVDLLENNDSEEVALILGYSSISDKGDPQPLVDQLMKAVKQAGIDLDTAEYSYTNKYDIWQGKLVRTLDSHGLKIWIPKNKYEINKQEYDDACDFEEVEDWKEFFPEPMMEGNLTMVTFVDKNLEVIGALEDDEIMDYWELPSNDLHSSCPYG